MLGRGEGGVPRIVCDETRVLGKLVRANPFCVVDFFFKGLGFNETLDLTTYSVSNSGLNVSDSSIIQFAP